MRAANVGRVPSGIAATIPSVTLPSPLGASYMHFHMPKPLHGWREFAGEVGIIVVGVLIALAFEQVVQSIHDRLVADQARDAIRAEVRENLWWLEFRDSYEPCIDSMLAELGAVLARAREGRPIPLITNVHFPVYAKITSLRWNANAEAGRTSLFSGNEQRLLGNMYFTTEDFRASQDQEETVWARMGFVEGLRHFTPADVHDLSVLLADARYRNLRAKLTIERGNQWASRLHLVAANSNSVENYRLSSKRICPRLTATDQQP